MAATPTAPPPPGSPAAAVPPHLQTLGDGNATGTGQYTPKPEEVRFYQGLLRSMHLYNGPVTGEWDQATWDALRTFQKQQNIGVSGQMDLATNEAATSLLRYVSGAPQSDVDKKVYALYGPGMAAYLDNPEVGAVLRHAAEKGYDTVRLQGELSKTTWWHQNSNSARQWEQKAVEDPRTAEQLRQNKIQVIRDQASQLGIDLDEHMLANVAEDSLKFAWDDAHTQKILTSFATYDPKKPGAKGSIGVQQDRLRELARKQMLKPTDSELFDYAKRISSGEMNEDSVNLIFKQQAKAAMPYLSDMLDGGGTAEDYFAETKRKIADALEQPINSIDLVGDSRWWPVLGVDGNEPNVAKRQPMSWGQTMQYINKMPEADTTRRMNQAAAQLANTMRTTFFGGS